MSDGLKTVRKLCWEFWVFVRISISLRRISDLLLKTEKSFWQG